MLVTPPPFLTPCMLLFYIDKILSDLLDGTKLMNKRNDIQAELSLLKLELMNIFFTILKETRV